MLCVLLCCCACCVCLRRGSAVVCCCAVGCSAATWQPQAGLRYGLVRACLPGKRTQFCCGANGVCVVGWVGLACFTYGSSSSAACTTHGGGASVVFRWRFSLILIVEYVVQISWRPPKYARNSADIPEFSVLFWSTQLASA